MNWDGVSPFSSSTFQLWPLYAVINELAPEERFNPENVLLLGLWTGTEKPNWHCFLQPIIKVRSLYKFKKLLIGFE